MGRLCSWKLAVAWPSAIRRSWRIITVSSSFGESTTRTPPLKKHQLQHGDRLEPAAPTQWRQCITHSQSSKKQMRSSWSLSTTNVVTADVLFSNTCCSLLLTRREEIARDIKRAFTSFIFQSIDCRFGPVRIRLRFSSLWQVHKIVACGKSWHAENRGMRIFVACGFLACPDLSHVPIFRMCGFLACPDFSHVLICRMSAIGQDKVWKRTQCGNFWFSWAPRNSEYYGMK